jgi:penicillin amidase
MLIVPRSHRRPRVLRRLPAALLLGGLIWLGARGVGPLPPVGALIDPWRGAWGLAATADLPLEAGAAIPGLGTGVQVRYDDRAVPHVFASTETDAVRALGYVVARDRLFQLDLMARAGDGSLTELLGPRALPFDREARRLGMSRAVELLSGSLPDTGVAADWLRAYAAGVNGYLDALSDRELPLEYRLLGRRPERWSARRTMAVLLRMGYVLTRNFTETERLAAAAAVGDQAAAALFPLHAPIQLPVQPAAGDPRRIPLVVPPPGPPDSAALLSAGGSAAPPGRELGSNNWAIAPGRTRDGKALLAGDPHLELTLPSIWYEAHLVVPGSLDVYGVTIPGLPAILIGFNRDVAWSFTNVEADLMDRWAEVVDDSLAPRRYRLDGVWQPLELRPEIYRGPGGDTLAIDTVRYTHRGPLSPLGRRWISLRWTALEGGSETGVFQRAAHARTAGEWLAATAGHRVPPQNMLVADRAGTIAVRSTGRFPLRPGDVPGDHLLDGSTRATDWVGDWPVADYPQATSPAGGFLLSANQEPQDPRDQRHYLGSNWAVPWRALRIAQLVGQDSAASPRAMARWQTDPGSARADLYLPYLLRAAEGAADTAVQRAGHLLAAWDRRYTLENEGAVLFENAVQAISARLWDELPPDVRPGGAAFVALLDDPANRWWDDRRTGDRVESRDDILVAGLLEGYQATVRDHGAPELGGWRWSEVHRIDIWHALHLPALSRLGLPVPGGPSTISPSSVTGGGEGASWRMVVELGTPIRAWATYPGGQSGNPFSARYDDRLTEWRQGRLAALHLPRSPVDLPTGPVLELRPAP